MGFIRPSYRTHSVGGGRLGGGDRDVAGTAQPLSPFTFQALVQTFF